jgi:hypothetical protein
MRIDGSQQRDEAVVGKVHVPNFGPGFIEDLPESQIDRFESRQ